jgi:hypothetical protein
LSHTSSPFCSGCFGARSHTFPRPVQTRILYFVSHCHNRHTPTCSAFFCVSQTSFVYLFVYFCQGWLRTMIIPVSASCIGCNDRHMPPCLAIG